MAAMIEVDGVTKQYGRNRGIVDLSFSVNEGEVFGFLGPNGAGKTTTIRTLLGFLKPNAGRATIAGFDSWSQSSQAHRLIGYLPGEFVLDPGLTGAQILAYLGNLRGGVDQSYVMTLTDRLQLDPSVRFRDYSRGNKQKVGLVQAFMHRPPLLIFDEPTSGLDPLNQQEFYRLLAEVRSEGRTVFLSSHNLSEVEHTCDRVGIIRDGRLATVGAVQTLKDVKHHEVDLTFAHSPSIDWFTGADGIRTIEPIEGNRTIRLTVGGDLGAVIRIAAQHEATNIVTREPSLEEIFLHYYRTESGNGVSRA